ncbi:MAG: T9SS type A sorting domain-containing protein [Bacteroidales bacterium]|jgi:hypothetical protein
MKKVLLLLFACGLMGISSYAQVSLYSFSQANGTFDTLTTSTVLGSTTITAGTYFYDTTTAGVAGSTSVYRGHGFPIGFTFTYNGINFNRFGINVDGWISFGQDSVNMQSTTVNAPINSASTAPAALQNRVSALGRSLYGQTNSQLSYSLLGSAPNRVLVVEWKRYYHRNTTVADNLNFQIRLYETTNVVEVTYGTMTYSASTTVQVGLRGSSTTDYNNRTSTTSWSTTSAGTNNTATVSLSNTDFPASGLTFIWTPPLPVDAGVSIINSPATVIPAGLTKVAVTVKNFGTNILTSASIGWSVNGVAQTPYSWSGNLATGATSGPDSIGTFNYTTVGSYYNIKSWTFNPNSTSDQNNLNDTAIKTIYVQGFAAIPFYEGFDSTWINKLNTKDAPSTYWINTPSTGNNSWRRDDDTVSAVWTSGGGKYSPTAANSTIHSARFHTWDATAGSGGTFDAYLNFSTVGIKMLKFWYINPSGTDSLALYMSTNGGTTYTFLQKYTTATAWTQYTVYLGTSVSPTTILRFKATSDYGNDDIGIDEVNVYLQPPDDMSALKWVAPVTGCGLTSSETVTVKFMNIGTASQSNIPVKYSINGGASYISGTIPGPVNSGDTATYSFATTSDFTTLGGYNCIVVVDLATDADRTNDTLRTVVNSIGTISGNPFYDDLESGVKYYYFTNSTNGTALYGSGFGNFNSYGFDLTGGAQGTWPASTSTTTTPHQAYSYADHIAKVNVCSVNAAAFTAGNLYLSFDLKQTYYSGPKYTYLAVVANGTDTLRDNTGIKYFNPLTANSDPFTKRVFDLSSFAGTTFTIAFVSANKYNDSVAGTTANNSYIDNIALSAKPVVNLGPDVSRCGSYTLDAGASATGYTYTYDWYTLNYPGTIATTQIISADSTAMYIVAVDNGYGVIGSDSATITITPLTTANAGPAQSICHLDTLNIINAVAANYDSIAWTTAGNGHFSNDTLINPTYYPGSSDISAGHVNLTLSAFGICDTIHSSFVLTLTSSATAFAGNNDTICYGGSAQLTATGGTTYAWSPNVGLSDTAIANPIASPLTTTTYTVIVSGSCGSATADVVVKVDSIVTPSLGADTTVCAGNSIILDAGTGYTSYNWSTGSTNQTITVDTAGIGYGKFRYYVDVKKGACTASDTIYVTFSSCVGIVEYNGNASVQIYPNPSNGLTNVVVNGINGHALLNVYTLQGQLVYAINVNDNSKAELDLSSLSKGVYIIRITNEKTNIFSKLIIQ